MRYASGRMMVPTEWLIVTKFRGGVTVLHCWQKTTQATAKPDKTIIVDRYIEAKKRLET